MKSIKRTRLHAITANALSLSNLSDADREKVLAAVNDPNNVVIGIGLMRTCPLGLSGLWDADRGFLGSRGTASSFYGPFDEMMVRELGGDAGFRVQIA